MPTLYQSKKTSLHYLLKLQIKVPDFQRSYTWDPSLVETFWRDIKNFSLLYPENTFLKQEYFIGSVVMVDPSPNEPKKIIDGQQRLATIVILLSSIRDSFIDLGGKWRDTAIRLQQDYIAGMDDFRMAYVYHLTLNQYDRKFFRREIQELRDTKGYVEPFPEHASHKLIRKARNYFLGQLSKKKTEFGGDNVAFAKWLSRIMTIVTKHLSVVFVSSNDEDNASSVFETLNDRGIGLSAPDLLRSFLLSRAEAAQREEIVEHWRDILRIGGRADVENFLRHYWLSHEGDVKERSLYREIKARIIEGDIDSMTLSREIRDEADTYETIITANDEDVDIKKYLEGIQMIGARAALPAILSAYAVGNSDQKKALLKDLITLQIRYSVVGGLENNRLENFLFPLAREIRNHQNFTLARQKIKEFSPNNDDFARSFVEAETSKSSATRYILIQIESLRHPTGELQVSPKVNLEHVYPRNPIGGKMSEHDSIVDKLGNLTLLSRRLNMNIKNADFSTKKPYYNESEFQITQEVASYDRWTKEVIKGRQEALEKIASSIWRFD